MDRLLVTGGRGFVGRHLLAELADADGDVQAPSRNELDLLDAPALREHVVAAAPTHVFHLAALASVSRSWEAPAETIQANVAMTLNLLEAVRQEAPEAHVLVAGSGEVYGSPESLPVDESARLRPQNPYAGSKAACDLVAGQYADAYELHVVCTRAFNQAGPGQGDDYVAGTLTRQVAEAEIAGRNEVRLTTGNPDSRRDFTDVRDAVRALAAAIDLEPGVYNVASGASASVADLIEVLRGLTDLPIRHEVDPSRVRARDVPEIRGSAELLRGLTGWTPEIPLEQTLADALDHWRAALADPAATA